MKKLHGSAQTLPLGIDVGQSRVRVALAQLTASGTPELIAVATRPRSDDRIEELLLDAVGELRTRERRCVFGIGEPLASLHAATLPPMRPGELERAARFEATRMIDYSIDEAAVQVVSVDAATGECVIGVARKATLVHLRSAAKAAKLRLLAVDNSGFALHRAVPGVDAVVDIGTHGSTVYIFGGRVPRATRLRIGGAAFTRAIVHALGTDEATAERRKCAHGIAGTGEDVRQTLIESVADALVDARANGYGDVRSIALVGNGARLDDLAAGLERATATRVELAALAPSVSSLLPPDVLRGAAPDWSQAYGLALWATA